MVGTDDPVGKAEVFCGNTGSYKEQTFLSWIRFTPSNALMAPVIFHDKIIGTGKCLNHYNLLVSKLP